MSQVLRPIKCKKCNKLMQWQITDLEALVHCQPCRRAVVVSDWHRDAKLLTEQPSDD
jgi:hypothetical protein